jgi:hypothetical protein
VIFKFVVCNIDLIRKYPSSTWLIVFETREEAHFRV